MKATLYRCPTPTNWLCRCGTVSRALRARDYEVEEIRVPLRKAGRDEVERLSGQRVVPVLVIEGDAICDSRRIVEHLEWRAEQA